jgi:tetratricopeptide (TPR) repeat protein
MGGAEVNTSAATPGMGDLPAATRQLVDAASAALQRRQPVSAEDTLRRALQQAPEHPEVLRLLALALRMQGRDAESLAVIRRAAASRPDDALVQNALGTALDASGDRDGAIAAFRCACELAPESPQLWANLGKTLTDAGRFEDALPVLERAVQMFDHGATHLRLAYALRVLGHTDAAAQRYRELIARDATDSTAWLGLATLKTKSFAEADIAAMQQVMRTASLSTDQRVSLGFALAKALDDDGRHAEAFALLTQANAQARSARSWNATDFAELTDAVLAAFASPVAGAPNGQGDEVIFIVSMPRAGSSLTEQILASHSAIEGGGELEAMTAVIAAESERRQLPFPFWTASTSPLEWQRLGQEYLQRAMPSRRAGVRFTDKLPGNWLRVGAIMAMLPGARVIDCRRDAVESCLSCFRTLFTEGTQPFSYDIQDLAAYWRDYDRTCRHWQTLYPQRFRAQSYEQLVAEPSAQIAELLDFCGLPFEDACLRFHETRRSVRTASASQVREPLMRNTARAPKYGALLNPLRAALGVAATD